MHSIRTARRARGLTITQLALLSGIPARALGAAEYGGDPLQPQALLRVAIALQMAPSQLGYLPQQPASQASQNPPLPWRPAAAAIVTAAAIAASWSLSMPAVLPAAVLPASRMGGFVYPPAVDVQGAPTAIPAPGATPLPAPTSAPIAPAIPLAASSLLLTTSTVPDGMPHSCPLLAAPDRVLITQSYGTGTHAPASLVGAIDLAIDADGDGIAEPDATNNLVVLATHSGQARVWLDSWPGGNVVRIIDTASGWSTVYAHLAAVAISDGQQIVVGKPIGRVGTSGMSSGPHLHYELWKLDENRDPTNTAPCWRSE
jgi:transcriptional regulator with XRE-family HTH domain